MTRSVRGQQPGDLVAIGPRDELPIGVADALPGLGEADGHRVVPTRGEPLHGLAGIRPREGREEHAGSERRPWIGTRGATDVEARGEPGDPVAVDAQRHLSGD